VRIGSLFSGIGGLELGLEWAGVGHTVFQVERDPYCQRVLAKHWPDALRFDDVCTVGAHNLPPVDVICGGFPCQDISHAGRGAGIAAGTRSGLWFEYERIVDELRPTFVVVENVEAIETRAHFDALHAVLGGLRSLGYRGERAIVSAADVGADHLRERWFCIANTERNGLQGRTPLAEKGRAPTRAQQLSRLLLSGLRDAVSAARVWRDRHGVPSRLDVARNRALGNAVVPQVAEVVGRRLLEIDAALTTDRAA